MVVTAADAAIGILIDNHDEIVRYVRRRVGAHADVNDIVQDAFFRLRNLPPDIRIENPRSYVFRVADNLAMDRMRRTAAQKRYISAQELGDAPAAAPSPEEVTDYRQRLARLREVVDGLPERQRAAFLMHKFDGLSHAEVATRMGISRSGVEKLVMKALATCRDELAGLLDRER